MLLKLRLVLWMFFVPVLLPSLSPVVDERLQLIYEEIAPLVPKECGWRGPLTIEVASLEFPTIGHCAKTTLTRSIKIDPVWWESASNLQLFLHEYAHCKLGLGHSPDPSHYRYYSIRNLKVETVVKQFLQDVEKVCNARN